MDTQRWELAGSIFERLLGTPPEKREPLLQTLCGADDELKGVVISMLQSESSAIRFERALADNELPTATVHAADSPDSLPGGRVGPWLLVRKIDAGGMGVVWLGERVDGQFEQRAAIKLIKRGMDSEAVLKRFLRERQILARLVHPHIAHLLDGGISADGRPYFAMEYVEGLPLLRYCHDRGMHLEERIRLFLRVCDAVQFAHVNHVVHRDLKPSNILITAGGDVKLLDFGIAKLLEGDAVLEETITELQRERPMTPMYAAPEQIRGERITEATDVYALGCVLYECLTGAAPFHRDSDVAILNAHLHAPPPRLRKARPDLPEALERVVARALSKAPVDRQASCGELVAAARDAIAFRRVNTRRLWASVAVVAGAIAASAAVGFVVGHEGRAPAAQPRTVTRELPAIDPHLLDAGGYSLVKQGFYRQALPLERQAVAALRGTGPKDAWEGYANFNLAVVLEHLNRCDEALGYARTAVRLEPKRKEAKVLLKHVRRCAGAEQAP